MTEEHRPPKDSRQLPPVFTRGGLLYTWLRVLSAEEKPFNGFFGSRGTRGSGGDVPPGLECFATMRMVQDFSHTAAQMGGKDSQQGISLQPLPGAPSSLLCFHRDPFTVSLPRSFPLAGSTGVQYQQSLMRYNRAKES